MVLESADQRKTVATTTETTTASCGSHRSRPLPRGECANSRTATLRNTIKIAGVVFVIALIGIGVFVILRFLNPSPVGNYDAVVEPIAEETEPEPEVEPEPEAVLPEKVDFQAVVDDWAASVGGNRSVLIYDLDRSELVGEYNADENYGTASLYKLFVVYEGYRRLENGEWSREEMAGSTGHTILECLDLAIRESYSPCAETLWSMIGQDNLDTIIENDFKITNSDISHLVSNPRDILAIMKIFYEHPEIKDETLIARMKDSFLNQPTTTYNWRQGLPSGFSEANVYNKVGWDWNGSSWNIYHDVAIVEFPEDNRHFIVVVMTNQVPFQKIRELGTNIEDNYNRR